MPNNLQNCIRHVVRCSLACSLTVHAASVMSGEAYYQPDNQCSTQGLPDQYYAAGRNITNKPVYSQTSPWSLPQQVVIPPEFKTPATEHNQSNLTSQSDGRYWSGQNREGQFVTQKTLDSLKQQQELYQRSPNRRQSFSYRSQRYSKPELDGGWSGQNNFKYPAYGVETYGAESYGAGSYSSGPYSSSPYRSGLYGAGSYGTGSVNPLYDAPAISPWGSGVDVLNQGGEFPMIPSEALGGLSPIYAPSAGRGSTNNTGYKDQKETADNMIFNPFTFLPDSKAQRP